MYRLIKNIIEKFLFIVIIFIWAIFGIIPCILENSTWEDFKKDYKNYVKGFYTGTF